MQFMRHRSTNYFFPQYINDDVDLLPARCTATYVTLSFWAHELAFAEVFVATATFGLVDTRPRPVSRSRTDAFATSLGGSRTLHWKMLEGCFLFLVTTGTFWSTRVSEHTNICFQKR